MYTPKHIYNSKLKRTKPTFNEDGSVNVPTTKNMFAIVDAIDAPEVLKFNWTASKSKTDLTYYAAAHVTVAKNKYSTVPLHKFIAQRMGLAVHKVIDHENRDSLDCRRHNLREALGSANRANSKLAASNKSGFKGVSWDKQTNKWRVGITYKRKFINLGRYEDINQAANVYDKAAIKYFGNFALTNEAIKQQTIT